MRKRFQQKKAGIQTEHVGESQQHESPEVNQLAIVEPRKKTTVSEPQTIVRIGESSNVSIQEPSFDHEYKSYNVQFSCGRIQNDSSWATGELKVICWISEKRYSWEKNFNGENFFAIGEHVLGHLEAGYGFPDVKCSFNIPSEFDFQGDRWRFVFTVNELSEGDQWYVVDFRNGPLNLSQDDYNAIFAAIEEELGLDPDDYGIDSKIEDICNDEEWIVGLCDRLQDEFSFEFDDESNIETIADLIDYVAEHLNEDKEVEQTETVSDTSYSEAPYHNPNIENLVKSIIVDKLGVDEWEVTLEASFTNDLGADSLDSVELIMEFEKEFGIPIPDEEAEKIATVGDAVAYIEANM